MKRRARARAAKRSNKYSRRLRDRERMGWCKMQACTVAEIGFDALRAVATIPAALWRCDGVIEADHAGERIAGKGTKAPDDTVIPMCTRHHRDRTESKGIFAYMSPEQRKQWRDRAVEHARELYAGYLEALW